MTVSYFGLHETFKFVDAALALGIFNCSNSILRFKPFFGLLVLAPVLVGRLTWQPSFSLRQLNNFEQYIFEQYISIHIVYIIVYANFADSDE